MFLIVHLTTENNLYLAAGCIRGFDSLHPLLSAKNSRFSRSASACPSPTHAKGEPGGDNLKAVVGQTPDEIQFDYRFGAGLTTFLAWGWQQQARSVLNTTALTITSIVLQGFSLASASPQCWSLLLDFFRRTPTPQI